MNDLVKGTYNKEQRPIVMGHDLHEVLGIRTDYMNWFLRMCGYGFTEGTDFISTLRESLGGCPGMYH